MNSIYSHILASSSKGEKHLVVLIDPDKMEVEDLSSFLRKLNESVAKYIFVGGSTVDDNATEALVVEIKKHSNLPVVLFPGDVTQITNHADALLFLSLISGNNSEYLIGKHIKAVQMLRTSHLEIIPTGYILIENGKQTAVEKVTNTKPLPRENISLITDTAKAGELLGMKLIYLEAGSGALHPVPPELVSKVKSELNVPLIVGGGIRTKKQLDEAYKAGADMVVIGTAFEDDSSFFNELKK